GGIRAGGTHHGPPAEAIPGVPRHRLPLRPRRPALHHRTGGGGAPHQRPRAGRRVPRPRAGALRPHGPPRPGVLGHPRHPRLRRDRLRAGGVRRPGEAGRRLAHGVRRHLLFRGRVRVQLPLAPLPRLPHRLV
ncbi:MAG: hypothetical protein AVDCRST_MAG68-2772, partial [uncultured Gemmatimonadetes bacterium]